MLQAAGWALWLADQIVWDVWDLVIRRRLPDMYPADALLFLAGAPMLGGLLLRPHRQPSSASVRFGLLDFLLLVLWWLDLYVSLVVCWQYPYPNVANYSRNFDLLSEAGSAVMIAVLLLFWRESQGAWKRFYAFFCGAAIFNAFAFFLINRALGQGLYYTGSWYDIPYCGSFAVYAVVALAGHGLTATPETAGEESYGAWIELPRAGYASHYICDGVSNLPPASTPEPRVKPNECRAAGGVAHRSTYRSSQPAIFFGDH
jgi:hypothetical protein